jgi:hypothetical protein
VEEAKSICEKVIPQVRTGNQFLQLFGSFIQKWILLTTCISYFFLCVLQKSFDCVNLTTRVIVVTRIFYGKWFCVHAHHSDPDKILATCSTVRASVHVLRGQKVRKEDKEGQSNITVTWKKERNSGCHHLSLGKWGPSNTIISSKWVLLFQKKKNNNKRKNLNGHWKLRDGVSLMRIMMMRDVGPTELQSTRASVQFVLTCTDDCRREEKRACVIRTINHFDHFGHRQLGLPVTVEFL